MSTASTSGLVHTITVTAAYVHDITQATELIREDDEVVYGDSGYLGIQKRPVITTSEHLSSIDYRINRRPGRLPHVSDNANNWKRYIESHKFSVHCKVEHAFQIVKCQFGYKKTVSRSLKKMRTDCMPCLHVPIYIRLQLPGESCLQPDEGITRFFRKTGGIMPEMCSYGGFCYIKS